MLTVVQGEEVRHSVEVGLCVPHPDVEKVALGHKLGVIVIERVPLGEKEGVPD